MPTRRDTTRAGFEVYHETHRKRYLHSPWVTAELLPKFPDLKLVADLSHWICVAETDTVCAARRGAPKLLHSHLCRSLACVHAPTRDSPARSD